MSLMDAFKKWRAKSGQYGVIHTACALAGRRSAAFWRICGPLITSRYREKWFRKNSPRVINLGGGSNTGAQWLTADTDPRADVYIDMTRRLPFPNDSLDGIFLEEAIEHIPAAAARILLSECHRCLKSGKPLRLSTPDLRWFVALLDSDWVPAGILLEMARHQLGADYTASAELTLAAVNSVFKEHGHVFIWDFNSLAGALTRAGFSKISRSSYRDERSHLGCYDSHADRFSHPAEMSMYIEAVK